LKGLSKNFNIRGRKRKWYIEAPIYHHSTTIIPREDHKKKKRKGVNVVSLFKNHSKTGRIKRGKGEAT